MTRTWARGAAVMATALVISGCALDDGAVAGDRSGGGDASEAGAGDESLGFGQTATWEGLVEVTVERPNGYDADLTTENEFGTDTGVGTDILVTNVGDEPFDPAGLTMVMRSGGVTAPQVTALRVLRPPDGEATPMIPPGQEALYGIAWQVADPDELELRVSLAGTGGAGRPVSFTGSAQL